MPHYRILSYFTARTVLIEDVIGIRDSNARVRLIFFFFFLIAMKKKAEVIANNIYNVYNVVFVVANICLGINPTVLFPCSSLLRYACVYK